MKIKPFVFASIPVLLVALIAVFSNFDQRCENAGYVGARKERCVYRLTHDLPLYEENLGRIDR